MQPAVVAERDGSRPLDADLRGGEAPDLHPARVHGITLTDIGPGENIDRVRVVLDPKGKALERPMGRLRGPVSLADEIQRAVKTFDPAWVAREVPGPAVLAGAALIIGGCLLALMQKAQAPNEDDGMRT